MPVVLLVRHGQASFGADDYDVLSDLGREQAVLVGAEIARRGLRDPLLVCGTLRRQRDTATELGLGEPAVVDGRLDEYDHQGLLVRYPSGGTSDGSSRGMQVLLDASLAAWVTDPDGDWAVFRDGAAAALADVAARGRDAVVVTSGGIIAAACGQLLGLGAEGIVALNRVSANCGLTKIILGRTGPNLVAFNEQAHFEPDRRLLTYR